MTYSHAEIWLIIAVLGTCTFLIRFSFLGLIGDRPMPDIILRLLRFTPAAVLPGMVAPLTIFPQATDGQTEPVRLAAAFVTLGVAAWRRSAIWGMLSGAATLYAGLIVTGHL